MRGRRKEEAARKTPDASKPFFARFLEDQHGEDAEAKVSARPERAQATTKVTKTTAAKPKSGGVTKTSATKLQTLKYPSDRDEWVLYPYRVEAATVKGPVRQTLKFPSDSDEGDVYVPVYINAADAPKTASAKPKKNAKVALTTKAADIDRVS